MAALTDRECNQITGRDYSAQMYYQPKEEHTFHVGGNIQRAKENGWCEVCCISPCQCELGGEGKKDNSQAIAARGDDKKDSYSDTPTAA